MRKIYNKNKYIERKLNFLSELMKKLTQGKLLWTDVIRLQSGIEPSCAVDYITLQVLPFIIIAFSRSLFFSLERCLLRGAIYNFQS
jgi:hypothetical protein